MIIKEVYKPSTPRYQRVFVLDRGHSMLLVKIVVVHVVPAIKANCQSVQLVVWLDMLGEHLVPSFLCTFILEYTSAHVVQCQFVAPKLTDSSTFGYPISADVEKQVFNELECLDSDTLQPLTAGTRIVEVEFVPTVVDLRAN